MKSLYAIVARRVVSDARTSQNSIIDIIEGIEFAAYADTELSETGIQAFPGELTFTILWDGEGKISTGTMLTGRFWVDTPRGKWIEKPVSVQFSPNGKGVMNIILNATPFAGEGEYVFNVELRDVVAAWRIIGTVATAVSVSG